MKKSLRAYLLTYNLIQLSIWATALINLFVTALSSTSKEARDLLPASMYASAVSYVHTGQTIAWLEVFHTAKGIAGGSVSTSLLQSLGRYVVLVFVVEQISFIQTEVVIIVLLASWAIADVIRYTFYLATLLHIELPLLRWTRYTAFIVLQPIGIVSEWWIYWRTLSYIDGVKLYAIRLPNKFNFAFDFGVWNRFVLLSYLYFGPILIRHMFRQRRAKLITPALHMHQSNSFLSRNS